MRSTLSRMEAALLLACLGVVAVALLAPPLHLRPNVHDIADQRTIWGIPSGLNVLSSLAFAAAGAAGLRRLPRLPPRTLSNMQRAMAGLFFIGLLLTAMASFWYHWQPDDAGLAVTRCGMGVAFAGALGLAAADRVGERAAAALGLAALLAGAMAVRSWTDTGNLAPWAVLQFGAVALVLWLGVLAGSARLDVCWSLVVLAFTVAKLLELNDDEVLRRTGGLVSGHTLQHLVAALAAWPVLTAIAAAPASELTRRRRGARQSLAHRQASGLRRSRL